jgi:hypothetical protein
MFHGNGKHARRRTRWVGPLFALEAITVMLDARSEAIDAIAAAQLAELAQS